MRISDWSSDVCSSDLSITPLIVRALSASFFTETRRACFFRPAAFSLVDDMRSSIPSGSGRIVDRKSVVSGKSVSVRVDLGGRRIIKTKTHSIRLLHLIKLNNKQESIET